MQSNRSQPPPARQQRQLAMLRQGIACQQRRDFDAAETLYRQILTEDPTQPDALHLLGLIAGEAGRTAPAIDLIRRAIKSNPRNPNYHHNLAVAYESQGDLDAAVISNQRALFLKPDFFAARFGLAIQLHASGRYREAVEQFRQTLDFSPDDARVHSNLGASQAALGWHDQAVSSYQRASELLPDSALIMSNLGTACQSSGELDRAIGCYRKAIELDGSLVDAMTNLSEALLEKGNTDEGLAVAQQALAVDPANRAAFALGAIAANATDDPALRDRLLNRKLVRSVDIEPDTGTASADFSDIKSFNAALCRHVLNHPTLNYEPDRKSTRKGRQTGELLVEPKGPVAWLETRIRKAVTEYFSAIPDDTDHPFLKQKPDNWRLAVWATVLDRDGHQLPHIHPSAWLSGVYYASVPEQDQEQDAGWLEFGRAPANLETIGEMPTFRMEPVPGRLYLFPSYFYHRTIPFAGDSPRISIAFDVVPAPDAASLPPLSASDADELLARARLRLNEGDRAQAREMADRVLFDDPADHRALHLLAAIARSDGLLGQSVDFLDRAILVAPDNAQYFWEQSEDLVKQQKYERGAQALQKALELGIDHPQAYTQLGAALSDMGRFDESVKAYGKAVDHPSTLGTAYYGMSLVSGFDPDAQMIERMERETKRDDLNPREQYNLHFALGRAYSHIGDADSAFAHFSKGNEIQHRKKPFSLETERRNTRKIMRSFPRSFFEDKGHTGDSSELPVFIIGMPRSGTTLVEQIIASHPRAHGAGEINDLWRVVDEVTLFLPSGASLPRDVARIPPEAWRILGEKYVRTIRRYSGDAARITDKLPFNYTLAGIINLMLPNARIIHCVRDELDTCVSCFTTGFGGDRGFTGNLRDLGGTYRCYQDLMAHWHEVMPGRIYDVQYEALVADTEAQSRALIRHIGLEWDDACLDFHKHERMVSTASVSQVREPVYKTSIERWRLFEKHLEPLINALKEDY